MKKSVVILSLIVFTCSTAFAQTMTIKLKNGKTITFATEEIEKVTFSSEKENPVKDSKSEKDALISQMTTLAAMAQQYYKKPTVLGGGGNTFRGFVLPEGLKESPNGTFSVKVEDDLIIITGIGKAKLENGKDLIVEMAVEKSTIRIKEKLN